MIHTFNVNIWIYLCSRNPISWFNGGVTYGLVLKSEMWHPCTSTLQLIPISYFNFSYITLWKQNLSYSNVQYSNDLEFWLWCDVRILLSLTIPSLIKQDTCCFYFLELYSNNFNFYFNLLRLEARLEGEK